MGKVHKEIAMFMVNNAKEEEKSDKQLVTVSQEDVFALFVSTLLTSQPRTQALTFARPLLRKDPGVLWSRASQNVGSNNKF